MTIVDTTKFAIGAVFAVLAVIVLWQTRSHRGFGQKRQAGAMLVVAAGAFLAIGLGLIQR